jgi:hypothetical protein
MIPPRISRRGFLFSAAASGLPLSAAAWAEGPDGPALAEGMLDAFLTGTTSPVPIYASADLREPLPNPVRADAAGRFPPLYLDPAITYRLRARTKHGTALAGLDFDPVSVANAATQSFRQHDSAAVARPLEAKLADFVSILDFHDPALGDDVTAAFELLAYRAFPERQAVNVYFPAGYYRITRQILPGRQISLRGAGMSATILDFKDLAAVNPVMKGAISYGLIESARAYDPGLSNKVSAGGEHGVSGADFSTVESLTIRISGRRPPGLDYALWSAARLFCRDVIAYGGGFKWCAGELQSVRGTGAVISGNANLCHFSNCHSLMATEHGFMADGTDANACTIVGCNAFQPAKSGFFDASLLGNSYVGCHASAPNGYSSVAPVGTNRTLFDGCYCEENGGNEWRVASPGAIVNPRGALPDTRTARTNLTFAAMFATGFVTGSAIDFIQDLNPEAFGSATMPAARAYPGGLIIRGQGERGDLYQMVSSGQQLGGGPGGGEGVSLVKRDGVSGADHTLLWLGDPRHRPAFPAGMIATLPGPYPDNAAARAGGLTPGEFYRQTRTNLVAVVV